MSFPNSRGNKGRSFRFNRFVSDNLPPRLERAAAVAYSARKSWHGEEGMADGTVAADQLRLFIERIERLEEEKKGIADDIRDVYAEAKANGYDPKIMRMVVRLRKMETHTRQEQDAILETYRQALGLE
jgi:uncharacterized protein (UPF0335 family)